MKPHSLLSKLIGHAPGQCYGHNYRHCPTPIKCLIGKILSNLSDTIIHFTIWLFRERKTHIITVSSYPHYYFTLTIHAKPAHAWWHSQHTDTAYIYTCRRLCLYIAKGYHDE